MREILLLIPLIAVVLLIIFWLQPEAKKEQSVKNPDTTAPTTEVIVVGTEYYKGANKMFEGRRYELLLRREPTNKHDRDAIAVIYKGVKVGYLSRARAKQYKTLVDDADGMMNVYGCKTGGNVHVWIPKK